MLINITVRSDDIASSVKDYASSKCQRFSRFYNNIIRVDVILDTHVENKYFCEIIVSASRNKIFVCQSINITATAAIDDAVDRMERILSDYKDMLRARSAKDTQRATRRLLRRLKQSGQI